jgi:SAM-dependent methyltransferase
MSVAPVGFNPEPLSLWEADSSKDVPRICYIVREAFFWGEEFRRKDCPRITEDQVLEAMERKGAKWLLLKEGWRTIAAVLYQKDSKAVGHIQMLSKQVKYLKGCGAQLLQKVEALVPQRYIFLWCIEPKLSDWYAKSGYRKTGLTDFYDWSFIKPGPYEKIRICQMYKKTREGLVSFVYNPFPLHHLIKLGLSGIAASYQEALISTGFVNLKYVVLYDSGIPKTTFTAIIDKIAGLKSVRLLALCATPSLPKSRVVQLEILASKKKGIKIRGANGERLGSAQLDWDAYYAAKKAAGKKGLREATFIALELYKEEHYDELPNSIVDVGCGDGSGDTHALLEVGCKDILGIEADEGAIAQLKKNTSQEYKDHIQYMNGAFKEVHSSISNGSKDIVVCSFTFAYRPPEEFEEFFTNCVRLLKPNGFIAGQFFGPFKGSVNWRTYHTEKEVNDLLKRHGLELCFIKVDPEGTPEIFGSDEPYCGDLIHVVARKKAPPRSRAGSLVKRRC